MSPLWLPGLAGPGTNPASAIDNTPQQKPDGSSWRWGTVTQTGPSALRVRLDGDSASLAITPDTLVDTALLPVGTRVWLQIVNRRLVVMGRSQGYTAPANTELGAGVDLNTYQTPGVWTQSQTAEASGGTNYPRPIAGVLEVVAAANGHVWQRYTPYGSFGNEFYLRELYSGTWYGWYRYSAVNAATGAYTGAAIAAASGLSVTVNFPSGRFSVAPRVVAVPTNSSRLNIAVSSISTASFVCRLDNFTSASAAASDFNWIAMQEQ